MAEKLGIKCKAYYNSATYGTPTWEELTCIRDLVSNLEWDKVEAPSRASRVKKSAKTMAGIGATGSLKVSDTDAGYIAVWEALVGVEQNLDLLILNGDMTTNGVRGFRYDGLITQGNEDQGAANALYLDIAIDPDADGANPVKYAVVTAGAPVFTTFPL